MRTLLPIVALLAVITPYISTAQDTKLEEIKPAVERHEFITRGNHVKEIAAGTYVIVGGFKSEANAKYYVDELKKIDFTEVSFGYLTHKAIWYIHFSTSTDIDAAKASRDKYRRLNMFRDAWLLTVHE